jgi:hypothetical protein
MIKRVKEGDRLCNGVNIGKDHVIVRIWRWWFGYDWLLKKWIASWHVR